jgi:hypothetical protein
MRSPVTALKEWWVNRSSTEAILPPLTLEDKRNVTFVHQANCLKLEGVRGPCGCKPRYKNDFGTVREFWVTPHPNRRQRRQWASKDWQRIHAK